MHIRTRSAFEEQFEGAPRRKHKVATHRIEEMLAAVNLLEVLEQEYDLYFEPSTNGWWNTNCPLPGHDDRSPSFGVNPDLGVFKCFGCSESGGLLKFIMKVEGLSFLEAVMRLSQISGVSAEVEGADLFRVLRDMNATTEDYLGRAAETDYPGGMSEAAFMRSFAERLRKHEARVERDPEEIAWVDGVYQTLDHLLQKEDQKGLNRLWAGLGKEMRQRQEAWRSAHPESDDENDNGEHDNREDQDA